MTIYIYLPYIEWKWTNKDLFCTQSYLIQSKELDDKKEDRNKASKKDKKEGKEDKEGQKSDEKIDSKPIYYPFFGWKLEK